MCGSVRETGSICCSEEIIKTIQYDCYFVMPHIVHQVFVAANIALILEYVRNDVMAW